MHSWPITNRDGGAIGVTADGARPKKLLICEALSELTHNKLVRSSRTTLRDGNGLGRGYAQRGNARCARLASMGKPQCPIAERRLTARWSGRVAGGVVAAFNTGGGGPPLNFDR